jgi:ribonuclease BN (tRNA processing enzyme)
MQLKFLGSGSAFCLRPDNFQSNLLLTSSRGRRLLIDCGGDIRFSLARAALGHRDIDAVYISHLHADHIGGLEFLGFTSRFDPERRQPIRLFADQTIMHDLWHASLKGGMCTSDSGCMELADYFTLEPVAGGNCFEWEGTRFELVPTPHVHGEAGDMLSYGLLFEQAGQQIFFSSDSRYVPGILGPILESAQLIFHDCETSNQRSGVHAHYQELLELSETVRSKMWLYHYNDGPLPDAVADGFRGFVACGQCFDWPD